MAHQAVMRVAVMGAGGTGGYFGGLLARAGEDVTFIARGTHLAAIRAQGLRVKSRLAGDFTVAARATSDPSDVGQVDLVLFCVKTYDTGTAAEQIQPLVGPQTAVLSVQNGIDNAERIAKAVGNRAVVGAAAFVISAIEAPGVIAQTAGPGRIVLGELDGQQSERTEHLGNAFLRAGIPTELSPDIQAALWDKFLFICALSGVTALTRLPIGTILSVPETRALFRETMVEVESVARANGVGLPPDCVDRAVTFAAGLEPWGRGSLATDLAAGRRLELESLNGKVVRLGREHSIPTPCNFAIYAALLPFRDGAPRQV